MHVLRDARAALPSHLRTVRLTLDSAGTYALHERIRRGDTEALDEITERLLGILVRRLERTFPRTPNDLCSDAVEDALLEYAARPTRFDPSRGVPLDIYLFRASSRNLINYLDAERRRKVREARYASSTRYDEHGMSEDRRVIPPGVLLSAGTANDPERSALRLWLKGERHVAAFAEALGLSALAPRQQRLEVKRFKDRILKRLIRRLHRYRHGGP